MPMTAPFVHITNRICNKKWKTSRQHVRTLVSSSTIKKTEVIHQPVPGKPHEDPNIMVGPDRLRFVESFTHLGSVLSAAATADVEVKNSIAKACAAFGSCDRMSGIEMI